MAETYRFRRLDNDEIIEVDFSTMMEMDCTGCITVQIGQQEVVARRVREPIEKEPSVQTGHPEEAPAIQKSVTNTLSLGFLNIQLADMEEDRKRNGFTGIEFFEDPDDSHFCGVRANTPDEMNRYARHRGLEDHNSRNGSSAMLSREHLEQAKESALRRYPRKNLSR